MFKSITKLSRKFKEVMRSNVVTAGTMLLKSIRATNNDIISLDRRMKALERDAQPTEKLRMAVNKATNSLEFISGTPDRITSIEDKLNVLNSIMTKDARRGTILRFEGNQWHDYTSSSLDFEKKLDKIRVELMSEISNVNKAVTERIRDIKDINTKIKSIEKTRSTLRSRSKTTQQKKSKS